MKTRRAEPPDLGARLARLRPVAQALCDPWFEVVLRPIDAGWAHAGITHAMGGFNPAHHQYYAARASAFAQWIEDPVAFTCPPGRERELATDVMRFAHDYLHAWCYRLFVDLAPEAAPATPVDLETLEEQAFFFVLSEVVAVVATDYWYLSAGGLRKRCGTRFDLGPMTIHYRERLLPQYRRAQPKLVVRDPAFLARIARLYLTGEFMGFSEQDLLDNRAVADWMVRELLISPRQRIVARSWLAHLGGLSLTDDLREARFDALLARYAGLIDTIAERVWQKIRHGRHDLIAVDPQQGQWRMTHGGPVDCRYTNLSQLGAREVDWVGGGVECWNTYVDQLLSRRVFPDEVEQRTCIATRVAHIRKSIDKRALSSLVEALPMVPGSDPAPLEMLFVN